MSTATASHPATVCKSAGLYFILRRLHSLTGLVFGGYLVVHLLINATLVEGIREGDTKSVYQLQVDKIHALPFLPLVEWVFIYLPIIYHTIYGIWIVATGQPNIDKYKYTKNYFYILQRVSAIVLIFFIVFHVFGMKGLLGGDIGKALVFDPTDATASTARHFNAAFWVWGLVYPLGILASCYHLANGFWTAAITWGLTTSKKAMQRWGVVCSLLFIFTFGCGMTALVALVLMGPPGPGASVATPVTYMQGMKMTRDSIDQYERGGKKLEQAVHGLNQDELLAMPIPGKWSTQQVVIHLADAEAAFADRIRRIIASDTPTLLEWSENDFAANLFYNEQSVEDAVALIDISRRQLGRVLRRLPDGAFARTGIHSSRGKQTLEEVIAMANWHLDHHLKFIAEKRAKLGK